MNPLSQKLELVLVNLEEIANNLSDLQDIRAAANEAAKWVEEVKAGLQGEAGEAEAQLDWDEALIHLQTIRQRYVEIGVAGVPGLTISLNPLLMRYERGERTPELHREMMAIE